ncbi:MULTISPECIES: NAD(P) transhydrogenase subunit alpha [unclassified Mesotoga]|jgi:NAD(P) transhydrogenase subunit alpha|uniref:NAD(P) transhydrogenase subunit alpha n=1 Tax=unclassified Mesotoga TaxID=1184398 RepID=UPI000AF9AE22|nr:MULTISPECIES: NAD(P) transhydrogenase subunit alpha [unclassified Mesotoga]MDD3459698.1 NAD(P) transhydrogenase subunit alpha [Mesotoga sp.]HAY98221.1 NAD(P)(+) transhydrogenase [Mesotoga sp.]HNS34689.1 NAD(P) transhydrogenase subunit alpha [Mesotoga sp.]
MLLALVIFLVACAIIGYRIISSVPSLLHTPLMSGMNALSGITVLGAIAVFATIDSGIVRFISGAALVLAMINVVGGFWVTDRMLKMFDSSVRRKNK